MHIAGSAPFSGEQAHEVALSVVVPVYGCAPILVALHDRLTRVLRDLGTRYEIILVDDRGHDGAWEILRELAACDPCVVACRLSRNVGQQLAITAGLEQSRGAEVVVMDCDLQDPPEAIPLLLARAREGFDIVFARRRSDHQSGARMLANRVYFRLLGAISGHRFDGELGAFSLISRRVVHAFLQFGAIERHYLMILYAVGFDSSVIEYERAPRSVGQSSYSLKRLLAHALSGLFFTTTRVLHWVIYSGLALAGAGILLAVGLAVRWYAHGAAPGWTSLIVAQFLVGGLITCCVGVTGLYVGRIFEEVQRRPLYFVQDRLDGRAHEPRPADAGAAARDPVAGG